MMYNSFIEMDKKTQMDVNGGAVWPVIAAAMAGIIAIKSVAQIEYDLGQGYYDAYKDFSNGKKYPW